MNNFVKIAWKDCLSHQVWRAFESGWPDVNAHFVWGLTSASRKAILHCMATGQDWYYVDVGYLTKPITRYPIPKIHELHETYFRIVKGNLHTIRGAVGDGKRISLLESQGIDVNFKGWYTGDTKHILLAPSSQTVTYEVNGISQEEWIKQTTEEIRKYTDREIKVRNKPRPGNEWWDTDIKDDLFEAQCLVTNMSIASVDAVFNKVPVICHNRNVVSPIASRDLKFVEKPYRPGHKTVNEWLKMVVENQFTLLEIESGQAYKIFKKHLV